ncbi:N-carbamoylputrescine amidase [Singulisphaera sp. GP187]|uniref:carbon-nitrogen hydrolase family protein n=1 Tax=Singulisphaera sp. GP187 TaxID=1882752 RepID=UPI0009274CA5|nr:carbon-nitrogen hydrolase family protein [Singulisphaera sp. GP187]SIN82304.1 N-carbamoylputrescine amidase [Singulisphaera sp. GP187]
MKIVAAAIQMPCEPLRVADNVARADALLRQAYEGGAELSVLPELFNTGYGLCPDYTPYAEGRDGPTLNYLRQRSRHWRMDIAAGFVEREGRHLYDSIAYVTATGETHVYRKRNLVFWERFRFKPGRDPLIVTTRWGRIGFAVCADMIYRRVWHHYRDRIDLAIVSAAWPDFADRNTGKKHWLFGHVGPLSGAIPGKVAHDLGIPVVFANQCGSTQTMIPVIKQRIADRFAGLSSISDGLHGATVLAGVEEQVLLSPLTVHSHRGLKSWRSTSHSARVDSSSGSELSGSVSSGVASTGEQVGAGL